ncbi:MAG: hypothetical protein H7Y09_09045 [Chitinophagaceae bacterium]|nr:hypothetical protein [Anaerolineae bacterium]
MSPNPTHKWYLIVDPEAKKVFDTLSSSEKRGVFRHLRQLLTADDPYSLHFIEMLKAKKFERFRRFRVGDYRVFFIIEVGDVTYYKHTYKGTLYMLEIHDRKEAY